MSRTFWNYLLFGGLFLFCNQPILSQAYFFACPQDVNYGCVRVTPPIPDPIKDTRFGGAACPSLLTHDSDHVQFLFGCRFKLVRIYWLIDCQGDTTPCQQEFHWRISNTDSVIDFPEDMVEFCEIPPLPGFIQDGLCGPGVPIFKGENIVGDCSNGNCVVERTWEKSACGVGLLITKVQNIEVVCNVVPVENGEISKYIDGMSVSPNPVDSEMTLNWGSPVEINDIRILNLNGKLVKQISTESMERLNFQINLQGLDPGIYHVAVNGKHKFATKFIKL